MITARKSQERGHVNQGWLDSYHSFSFAEYYDEDHMNYSVLRVINEDVIAGGTGFGMHPHRDMEIVTYVLSGELRHQDNMSNSSVIRVGDVQRMTAGTGVTHSEFNAKTDEPVHLLQIWIAPSENGLQPGYEEKCFSVEQKNNRWCLIASPNGHDDSVIIHQDASIYATLLDADANIGIQIDTERCGYLQVAKGDVILNGVELSAGDAAKVEDESTLEIIALSDAEMLWFDLPEF
jgi:quercetin 2,3-dioxygenase